MSPATTAKARRFAKRTVALGEFILDTYINAVPPVLDIEYDDLAVDWRKAKGIRLDAAQSHVKMHVAAAREWLEEEGYRTVLVTAEFFSRGCVVPSNDREIKQCVAGCSVGSKGVGIHVVRATDDNLSVAKYLHELSKAGAPTPTPQYVLGDPRREPGKGILGKNLDRMEYDVDSTLLTPAQAATTLLKAGTGNNPAKQIKRITNDPLALTAGKP